MNLRVCLFLGMALSAWIASAVLPESVLTACLSPEIKDHTAALSWQVMDAKTWNTSPIEVSEVGTTTELELDGKEHPNGWLRTEVRLEAPKPTDAAPMPTQRLLVTARSTGVLPQTTVDFVLLKEAKLPPYRIEPWGDRIAIIAEAGDWYLATEAKTATITQSNTADRALTVCVPNCKVTLSEPATATLLVGEGPLPASPTP